ncbi:Electron transfer flavoprotein-ubiquinone oxidoreductase [Liberibacter crescens BT-1]|uniref:Electron transfer flavoprotein-ubiquinone oxidoreductase n=1 Tax=Liberibacter crescens (strain BT-1) TaxID=1215343 RepID=L0EVY9_LIBCB|nr:electron transfer flavoprotein-ubiquinone oxidoreductase [Liberibacter crescens]AGA64531.1 Electron transfer flavoprotein-ubiquinone oxidoreductase [Liberibacter crescens BT-1]AMC12681.1 electron transfer flavoprotein-ubiquinone oxidoreductase [Liberibacter crescens]
MSKNYEFSVQGTIECDVLIVGAGPAGLSAAIRLKQKDPELSVIVLEKAAEVGGHILSGAVIDPVGINTLFPNWEKKKGHPFYTQVREDRMLFLSSRYSVRVPQMLMPPLMNNQGNYIVSLGEVCRWMATEAEKLGVEIYAGFSATGIHYSDTGAAIGVFAGEMGKNRDGSQGENYVAPMLLLSKYMLIAEGACGSLTQQLIARYHLAEGRQPQKFGLGIKELWRIESSRHHEGLVVHSLGWPLDKKTGGGGFIYHFNGNLVSIGFVLHLDYRNPWCSPYEEFQRFKTHPNIKSMFSGGERISYGARVITEGGWQSVPRLSFPGGALIGCSAGFVNLPRIKGSHNAMLSGIFAADNLIEILSAGRMHDEPVEIEQNWRQTNIGKDLWPVRNVKPLWSRFGSLLGIPLGFLDVWSNSLWNFSLFGTMNHTGKDSNALESASKHKKIEYPNPDGVLTFDCLSSVFLSNVYHSDQQPVHLLVKDSLKQKKSELGIYAGPSTRYCPAGVYEWIEQNGEMSYVINAQNCIHCKTCVIKDPNQNICWVPPQGGEGPFYSNM